MIRKRFVKVIVIGFLSLSSKGESIYNDVSYSDTTFNLAKELLEKDDVLVPPGDHYVNETIVVPGFKKITGIVGKSKLIAAAGFRGPILVLDGVTHVEITGIAFEGNQNQFSGFSNICNTREAIRKLEGKTQGIAILIKNGAKQCWINTCEFKNFGDACLKMVNAGGRGYPVRVAHVSIANSFCGIDNYGTEYSPTVSASISDCVFGLILDAGNQYFSTCSFNDNKIGLYMKGANKNNSHGSFAACNFNHSKGYSIFCDGIDFGETFVGCQVFDGDIFLENTNGFIFNGGIIDAQVFVMGGKTNMISNTGFLTSYGGGKIHSDFEGLRSRLVLKNNFFLNELGGKDSLLNN